MNKLTKQIVLLGHIPSNAMQITKDKRYVSCRYCGKSIVIDSSGASGDLLNEKCTDETSIMLAKQYLAKG